MAKILSMAMGAIMNDKSKLDIELNMLHHKWCISMKITDEGDLLSFRRGDEYWTKEFIDDVKSIIEAEVEKAVIQDRLDTWQRFKTIHEKYPNNDKDSDRKFRNDFMSEFSKFMDETTTMIKSKKEN